MDDGLYHSTQQRKSFSSLDYLHLIKVVLVPEEKQLILEEFSFGWRKTLDFAE